MLSAVTLAAFASAAFAQAPAAPAAQDAAASREIIVEAPRSLPAPKEVARSPFTGAPIMVFSLRIPVQYGDLDLASPRDAARLMTRLDRVAHDACAQLDRLYPLVSDPDCHLRTMTGARPGAQALIDAAKSGP
jgi:UrcA family protein